jgi:hypothetical protein
MIYSNPKFKERLGMPTVCVRHSPLEEDMLAQEVLLQLKNCNFDLLPGLLNKS